MRVHHVALRAIRTVQGRTIAEVADKAPVDRGYLSRLERGEKGATRETVQSLASALGVPVEALLVPGPPAATVRLLARFLTTADELRGVADQIGAIDLDELRTTL